MAPCACWASTRPASHNPSSSWVFLDGYSPLECALTVVCKALPCSVLFFKVTLISCFGGVGVEVEEAPCGSRLEAEPEE